MSLNVIKLTGRACFVVHAKPGVVTRDGQTVPCEEIAREIAEALALAIGCSAVVVPEWVRVDVVEGEPTPLDAPGLPPTQPTKVRQRPDGKWEPCEDGQHEAEVLGAC